MTWGYCLIFLRGYHMHDAEPFCSIQESFHLATMGGAEVLGLHNVVGNFLPGKQVLFLFY